MPLQDCIFRFTIDNTQVRGQLVRLDQSWRHCVDLTSAGPYATHLLGESLAAISLLAETIKIDGNISLQIRGSGAIHLLVAQATSKHTVRGLVRQSAAIENSGLPLAEVFASDKMAITIETGKGRPHQGIVALSGNSLQLALEAYFEQSEQLPTRLWLASNERTASGLLLQRLPGQAEDQDGWNRLTQLASTITDEELIELDPERILGRLFHQEPLRLFDPSSIRFACSCSRQRTENMIKSLGWVEAMEIVEEQERIDVTCEFCNASYQFDAVDVERIFHDQPDLPDSRSLH